MKKIILSLTLPVVGLVLSFGFLTAVHAADAPDYNTTYTQIQQQANDTVQAKLNANPTPNAEDLRQQAATTSAPASSPSVPAGSNVIVLNTGDNVKLDTSSNYSSNTSVTNNNNATINQNVDASANTGNNTANRNISYGGNAGSITTGNAAVNTGASASANDNYTAINGSCQNIVSNTTIYNTGDNLDHTGGTSSTCNTTVVNNNNATINQVVNGDANTGGNQAERNIAVGGGSAGQIVTGNASVGSLVTSQGNQNIVIVGGQSSNGGPGSGANIYILNTGDNADLSSYYSLANNVSVTNNNNYYADQSVNGTANTGDNSASRNINQNGNAGVIETGDATVNTSLSASANKNQTYINGSGGSVTDNVKIVNTGDNLHSDTNTSVNNSTSVTNNNNATINQTVNATANTGNNDASRNIAYNGNAGSITTGNATVNTVLAANANQNATVISGAEGTATSNLDLINTGDNANVTANTTTNNSVSVTNNNNATVNQAVNVDANTGNNTANNNIGGGSISTGGITVNTNVISHANGSYTFVIESGTTGLDVFNQFLQMLMGMNLQDVLGAGMGGADVIDPGQTGSNNTNITNTGDNATVLANNTSTRTVVVTNNNTANINQSVNVNANTGNNTCNNNVGSCDIKTGDVVVTTTLLVDANFNFTIIGNVGTPVDPEPTPEPVTPVTPEEPKAADNSQVLAAETSNVLPSTGAGNYAVIGLALLAAGALLRRKSQTAEA